MVYEIIDGQWDPSLSAKINYRISGDASDPNSQYVSQFDLPEYTVLSIPQAVAIATGSNRQYETEKENLYLTALDFTEVRHLYEPMPILGGDGGYRKDGGEKAVGAFGNFGFQQLLATGAQVGGNISLGWMDIISGDFRSGFSSVASAVISQPLLRGAGRKVALENLTQAERNTLYQIRTFNRYRKEFVTSVISDYYLVLQLNDTQINARDNYYALFETHQGLQKRAVAGKVQQHELEQANQDKLTALSDYTQARKNYRDALDSFKVKLALSVDKDLQLDTGEFDVLKRSMAGNIELTEAEAIEIALNQRLDLANVADYVIDAERKVDVAADAIRAELNIIGYANPQTHQRTVFGADPGQLESTRDRYQLSAQLDLPIDRLQEKNAYRRALIVLMQSQRSHQELTDTVTLQVRKSYRKLQEAYRRYQVENEALQVAEKRTQNTVLLLKYQRANTRDVLDARDDLLESQDAATSALVDYATASLEFFRDTGTMKIKPDGMWEKSIPAEFHAKADN
jgi:outer membrane protein TolC